MLARPVQQSAREGQIKPALGGINQLSPIAEMPDTDAVYLRNLIPSEWGLRCRLGSTEWCTGVDSSGPILELLPFNGSQTSKDRLFAVTKNGMWNVTSSTSSPSQVLTFTSNSGSAGNGSWHVMVTSAGHFLMYCDEVNGYHLYTEQYDLWQKVVAFDSLSSWTNGHGYTAGDYVKNGGNAYKCTQSGTSAGSGGPTGTDPSVEVTDNTAKWKYNYSISGVDPANFVHVLSWKGRAWFTQVSSASAWYLGLSSVIGTATEFKLGNQFRAGGYLVGIWNWTTDGGSGVDNFLVAVSSGGDVVIYQGTDPAGASTFGIKGVWQAGSLPAGRHIASELGGDLVIASIVGLVPLSELVVGKLTVGDRSQYLTGKVQNLFNYYTGLYGANVGWQMVLDPKDNALLILVPITSGAPNVQLAMSLATRGWFTYTELPMNCAAPWSGVLYFGTPDGRVVKHDGYVDGVTLAAPTASQPIQWSQISSFQSGGSARKKKVRLVRPKIMAQSGRPPVSVVARYDFDLTQMANVAGVVSGGTNAWDTAVWDADIWGGDYSTSKPIQGARGTGTHVAIGIAGLANSRTIFAGADVLYSVGGFL